MKTIEHVDPIFELAIHSDGPLRQALARQVKSFLERLLLLRKLDRFYFEAVRGDCESHFIDRILATLDAGYEIDKSDRARIPTAGPLVVVANHPFGMLDGVVLASIVRSVRPDFKLLANSSLSGVTELCDTLIPIDPYGRSDSTRANTRPIREAIAWLRKGGALGVFPAGEVAHLDLRKRAIIDPEWSPSIARIIRKTAAQTLPVLFDGSNSLLFQLAGLVHAKLRTGLLPREFLNKRGKQIDVEVGSVISSERLAAFDNDEAMIDYLRRRTHLLMNRGPVRDNGAASRWSGKKSRQAPIVAICPPRIVAGEVTALPPKQVLLANHPYTVFYADSNQIPATLKEIGRLREITFRQANEGTGKETDLDEFDSRYVHLFLWNEETSEVVGAYRIGRTDEIVSRFGRHGLYTHSLFDYDGEFLDRINPALELGRSFVRPEYQKAFPPLFLLWKGIAQYVARHPQYKTLFGPVSISNAYHPLARRLIVNCLTRPEHRHELADLVTARTPFRNENIKDRAFKLDFPMSADIDEVSALISDIETDRKGIPVMLKQYLKFGGKLLGFSVDHSFGDTLDGLILVDLTRADRARLTRLMGEDSVTRFLEFHSRRYLLAS